MAAFALMYITCALTNGILNVSFTLRTGRTRRRRGPQLQLPWRVRRHLLQLWRRTLSSEPWRTAVW